jgi:hypothetical protein
LQRLGNEARMTPSAVHRVETGRPASLDSYGLLGVALGLRPELQFSDPRRANASQATDDVHAWMGDAEAKQLLQFGFGVSLDEPYQHYQFAGRGDLVAWSAPHAALLHIENKTRIPNLQDALGSYNAKRRYLAASVTARLGLRGGFESVTHVLVGLWSAEVLHVLRLREATFRAVCPDPADAFGAWWSGTPPRSGVVSCAIVLDPQERPRARRWVGLDCALLADPRYRGYADAAARLHDH